MAYAPKHLGLLEHRQRGRVARRGRVAGARLEHVSVNPGIVAESQAVAAFAGLEQAVLACSGPSSTVRACERATCRARRADIGSLSRQKASKKRSSGTSSSRFTSIRRTTLVAIGRFQVAESIRSPPRLTSKPQKSLNVAKSRGRPSGDAGHWKLMLGRLER